MASPNASCAVVDDVGTIFSKPASLILGIKNLTLEYLYSKESFRCYSYKFYIFISGYILYYIV